MKRIIIAVAILASAIYIGSNLYQVYTKNLKTVELQEQHLNHLENSPFKLTQLLSKEERKALGLPPNAYFEQLWERTMDPSTGRPMPERAIKLQQELWEKQIQNRGVGGDDNNPWIARNRHINSTSVFGDLGEIGGRTRGIMFDPNDSNNEKVFAGGVSGGLWVNNDITDSSESWTLVTGIPNNLYVRVIISDPNDSNTFYLGAGESYTFGDCIGNGVWKSTDAGVTWTQTALGGYTGTSTPGPNDFDQLVNGIFYINDLVARDIGATTELFAAVGSALFADGFGAAQGQWHSLLQQGLYKSTNGGTSWSKITGITGGNFDKNPNDIEIDINNNVWLATHDASGLELDGGDIYKSTDGTTFTLEQSFANTGRCEIEVSQTSANELWVLLENTSTSPPLPQIWYTSDAFATAPSSIALPIDADVATIPINDFTRGQSFYDLEIEVDGSGNLYIGGIDWFRSTNNGSTWAQISEWYDVGSLTASLVHADQQALVFRPGNDNQAVIGTDGGIYYASTLSGAVGSTSAITTRNKNYATLQYYYGDIDQIDGEDGDDIIGGAQDNGTSYIIDAAAGANVFSETFGGDGAFVAIDNAGGYAIQSYIGNDHRFVSYPSMSTTTDYEITSGNGGTFINVAELDKNLDILYSDSSEGAISIERNSNFTEGTGGIVTAALSDAGTLNSTITAMKVSPYTGGSTKLFVGMIDGGLVRIDNADGGVAPSYTEITGASFVGSISDIEFGEDETEIFVTMSNYGVTSIWFTTNSGSSWTSIEGNLPDIPVNCILQNPLIPQEIIIGTQFGVWGTPDYNAGSPSWIQTQNGMKDVPVVDLDVRTSDNVILATTYGRGFFTSQFTSNPLSVDDFSIAENTVSVIPTVSDGNFRLKTLRALGEVSMALYNISGQRVYEDRFEFSSVDRIFNLDLESGMYFIKLENKQESITKRIIIR